MRGSAAVIIDSREPPLIQVAVLAALTHVPATVLVTMLETGDFVVRDGCSAPHGPCLVGIERKKVADLLGSFRSGRLDKQLARLKAQYAHPILLVEGELRMAASGNLKTGGHQTRWSHASVQMFLWSLQRRREVAVLSTHGTAETADLVRVLARRAAEGCVAHLEIVDAPRPAATRKARRA